MQTSDLMPFVHLAQSPYMDCCPSCMAADALPEVCPVALNICNYVTSSSSITTSKTRSTNLSGPYPTGPQTRKPTTRRSLGKSISDFFPSRACRHPPPSGAGDIQMEEMVEKKAVASPLRQHLFQTVTQELVTRKEGMAKVKPTNHICG